MRFDCMQLTTQAEPASVGWDAPRPESDDPRVKSDISELGKYGYVLSK